ncbi:MAG: hypothetical protein QOD00_1699 [Blastocatellia bacterium]|nr:hypothetical protein [Blastocatellia bacterium]
MRANIYSLGPDRWPLEERRKVRAVAQRLTALQEASADEFEREEALIAYARIYLPRMVASLGVKSEGEAEPPQVEPLTDDNVVALGDVLLLRLRNVVDAHHENPTNAETSPGGSAQEETPQLPPETTS